MFTESRQMFTESRQLFFESPTGNRAQRGRPNWNPSTAIVDHKSPIELREK
jgi:hypothetical protein